VVLPTPPFWLAIVMIRHRSGRGHASRFAAPRTPTATSAWRAMGVSPEVIGASGTTTGASGSPWRSAVRKSCAWT